MNLGKGILIEAAIHVLFWLFILSAVNVNWASDWFDPTIRPNTPAPLSVLIFPLIFYSHAFWAIPKYLNLEKWKTYLLCFFLIFIVPEIVRSGLVVALTEGADFWGELHSRDSFLLGNPNIFWLSFTFSFAYRFTKDWFVSQHQIEKAGDKLSKNPDRKQPEMQLLEKEEADLLFQKLEEVLSQSKPYLNPALSLSELAKLVGTTDKKLSIQLNQNMHTNFYAYINSFRIATFKKNVEAGELGHLSIVGLALQCGFKSKSSFYRAFKKEVGMSPSEFIQ